MAEKDKKNRRETAVPPPFLHSSILFSTKITPMPNFRAVTLLLTEIMRVLLSVSKSGTSTPSLFGPSLSYDKAGVASTKKN